MKAIQSISEALASFFGVNYPSPDRSEVIVINSNTYRELCEEVTEMMGADSIVRGKTFEGHQILLGVDMDDYQVIICKKPD